MKFKRVLVTGGAGCIGMPVCKELKKRGIEPVLFDLYEQIKTVEKRIDKSTSIYYGSILDSTSIREAMKGCDGIIHLAAYLGVRRTELNKLRCLEINIDGTRKVLEAAAMNNIKKIVFASSSEVYGEPIHNPISEKDITQGKTVYAVSKLAGEELVKSFHEEFYKLNFTILRYFNTYGPYQIAQFVIPKFIRNVMNNKSPIIYGDGNQLRSYNFSNDTARGTVDSLLSSKANNKIINIGNSDELINLKDLANLIIELCGKKDKINIQIKNSFNETDRDSSREIFERYCSTKLAKKLINYQPNFSLRKGLKKVIETGVYPPNWATSEKDYTIDDSIS
tara:strand:- start:204 stop:1211 length:1008 start_codon:yes stop_codon:yes gene_type:complete